ncbi:MAG: tetratricopeptide repeat protein [Acidobacteriota bacterium]
MNLQPAQSGKELNNLPLMEELIQERNVVLFNSEIRNKNISFAFKEGTYPPSLESHYSRGVAYYQSGDLKKAVNAWEETVKLFPEDADTYLSLGIVYIQLDKFYKALKCLNKGIRLSADASDAHYYLGYTHYKLQHWQQAEIAFEQAIEINKKDVASYFSLALMYVEMAYRKKSKKEKCFNKAFEICKRLVENNRLNKADLNDLGMIYNWLGKLEEAEKVLEKALKLDPNDAAVLNNLRLVKENQLEQKLFEIGLLKRINEPITDFTPYKKRVPIKVKGKPISETIIEERR